MSCGSQWVALLPPQQHIPSPRLGMEAYVVAKHALIARRSQPRLTWNSHVKAIGVLNNPFGVSNESQLYVDHNGWPCFHLNNTFQAQGQG